LCLKQLEIQSERHESWIYIIGKSQLDGDKSQVVKCVLLGADWRSMWLDAMVAKERINWRNWRSNFINLKTLSNWIVDK